MKKRIQGGKPQNSTRLTVSLSLFHETFLTSTFQDNALLNASTLRPDDSRSLNVHDRRFIHGRRTHQVFNDIQALNHETPTLETRKVTKLHQHDLTTSNDEFPSYAQSITLISTRSTTPPVYNQTLDLYREGATLFKFIHEGRLTTTKRLSLLFEASVEPIRRLYGIPGKEKFVRAYNRQYRQDSSISSHLVEYFSRYKHQSLA